MPATVDVLLTMSVEDQAAQFRARLLQVYGPEMAAELLAPDGARGLAAEPDEGPGYDDLPRCGECGGRLVPFRPCCQDDDEPRRVAL